MKILRFYQELLGFTPISLKYPADIK